MSDTFVVRETFDDYGRRIGLMCELSLRLDLHNVQVITRAKFDTGCPETCINVYSNNCVLLPRTSNINEMRHLAYSSVTGSSVKLSFGVNDTAKYRKEQYMLVYSGGDYEFSNAVSYEEAVSDFYIGDCKVPVSKTKVNYNRIGSVLLGLDVIDKAKLYAHYSRVDCFEKNISAGTFIILGTFNQNSAEFDKEMKHYFGKTDTSDSLLISRLYKKYFEGR